MYYPLIMYETVRICLLIVSVHLFQHIPGIGFISQRPEQNGRMVFKHFKIRPHTVQNNLAPCVKASRHIPRRIDRSQLLPGTVGFQIRLRHHVDPRLVTAIIPADPIRIMASAHSIDIVSLHARNVENLIFFRNAPSLGCIPLMPVDTVDDQTLSV